MIFDAAIFAFLHISKNMQPILNINIWAIFSVKYNCNISKFKLGVTQVFKLGVTQAYNNIFPTNFCLQKH